MCRTGVALKRQKDKTKQTNKETKNIPIPLPGSLALGMEGEICRPKDPKINSYGLTQLNTSFLPFPRAFFSGCLISQRFKWAEMVAKE